MCLDGVWKYLKGKKQTYKEVTESHHPLISLDGSINRNEISGLYTSVSSPDYVTKDNDFCREITESEEVNLRDINTPIEHIQTEDPSTHIKEESVSWQDGNLVEAFICTTEGDTQMNYTTKCESTSNEKQIPINTDIYTGTDHRQTEYPPDLVKVESASCEIGTLSSIKVYTPMGDKQMDYTSNNESVSNKEEIPGNIDIYAPTEHTQTEYSSTLIKEESKMLH
ncbi:uncharacterized protein LOC134574848 [Pelobates fuscus]|uniref:uncharacterized protein LOC134574848 n=1 Tax=Pelobates fuscus TaxID=191477 RepID=UPI002FE43764